MISDPIGNVEKGREEEIGGGGILLVPAEGGKRGSGEQGRGIAVRWGVGCVWWWVGGGGGGGG